MQKIVKLTLIGVVSIIYLSGCSRGRPAVAPQGCQKGMFCYENINFGPSRGSAFEKGVKDGCKTANGSFRKDYYLSSSNKNYYDGWILGRSKCKQTLPNEGTRLAEQKSRQRAEYQIRQLKMQKEQQPETESIVDSLLDNSDTEEVEY